MCPIRVGIVGVGFAGKFHYESLQNIRGVECKVVGVTSKRKESREAFAAERGIRAFESVEEMLDEVDVLDICSPPYVHEANILAAARKGKHVICEKPLTGHFGPEDADDSWRGDTEPKAGMLQAVRDKVARLRETVGKQASRSATPRTSSMPRVSRRSARSSRRRRRSS